MRLRPLALLLATACQTSPPAGSGDPAITSVSSAPPGDTTGPADASSSGDAADTASDASSGEPGTTAAVLDVGSTADLGDDRPPGCAGKIDFLFVIARSGGMKMDHERLRAAAPGFIATIQAKFADFDYHIMMIDADEGWGAEWCTAECPGPFDECDIADYPCDLLDLVTECDHTLGAGTVFPMGAGGTNAPCPIAGGRRYMTREQPDLTGTFDCLAKAGTGAVARTGDALAAAMSPQLTYFPGNCNEGFLRDDALLMVTLLGVWDQGGLSNSAGYPAQWAKAVVDAKHGDWNSVVMLNINDPTCPQGLDRLCVLTRMFPYHHVGDRYAPDYGPAFDIATDLVETACAGFTPPG